MRIKFQIKFRYLIGAFIKRAHFRTWYGRSTSRRWSMFFASVSSFSDTSTSQLSSGCFWKVVLSFCIHDVLSQTQASSFITLAICQHTVAVWTVQFISPFNLCSKSKQKVYNFRSKQKQNCIYFINLQAEKALIHGR